MRAAQLFDDGGARLETPSAALYQAHGQPCTGRFGITT